MKKELYTDITGFQLFELNETFWAWVETEDSYEPENDFKFTVDEDDTFIEEDGSFQIVSLKSVVFG